MSKLTGFWTRLQRAINRRAFDQQMAEEMREHLERESARRIAAGEDPATARRRAAVEFGHADSYKEQVRDHRLGAWLEQVVQDVRYAARGLRKAPGFTTIAVVSLALGIGANTAIFSLVNEFLLRALPVRNPEELVIFRAIHGAQGSMSRSSEGAGAKDPVTGRNTITSFPLLAFERFQAHHPTLSDVFAFASVYNASVAIEGESELNASAQMVSGNYHAALGVTAAIGRTLVLDDDHPGAEPVAVISHRYWQNRFGHDPDVLGRTLQVNRVPVIIVGVTAPGFAGTQQVGENPDVTVPLGHFARFQPDSADKNKPWYWWIQIMGRLAPGTTREQARASLEPMWQEVATEGWRTHPAGTSTTIESRDPPTLGIEPGGYGENDDRNTYAKSLHLLMALVSLVLLVACANVANLLLARGAARRREIAVRLALGASRARIVGQLLAESLLLGGLGAMLGLAFAFWGRGVLVAARPFGRATVVMELPFDGHVLGFTIAVALATAMIFGLAPALRATRLNLTEEFQGGARTMGSGHSRLSRGLMVVQVALSVVLLISTGLFLRTLRNLHQVDSGFNHHELVLFRIDALSAGVTRTNFDPLCQRIAERLERISGVRSATYSNVPLLARGRWSSSLAVPGLTPSPGTDMSVNMNAVAPNFFATIELPLVLGRAFTERDGAAAPKVAVVNQALVRTFFPGNDSPIGHRFLQDGAEIEIVGVIRDAKYNDLRAAVVPTAYLPALQSPSGQVTFAVRGAGDPTLLFNAIRGAVREIAPGIPVANLRTQEQQLAQNHAQELLFARFSGFFGLLALGLACVGLYGLMSYAIVCRNGEIGLRMALGALPDDVLRMVLKESLALVCAGIVLGVAGAWGAGRFVASMLFGLSPTDPLTYVLAAGVLLAVAVLAAFLPARRATKIDPMVALRTE